MKTTIVVNTFSPEDKGYAERQEYAMKELYRLRPHWAYVHEARLLHDGSLDHATYTLNRDSAKVIGSTEHLPFVREIVQMAQHLHGISGVQNDRDWFGFINNDTIVTEAFFQRLEQIPLTKNMAVVRVWDIPDASGKFEPKRRGANADSNDGILMRYPVYLEFMNTFPDMVLAAGWDTTFLYWARRFKIHPVVIDKGECLHVTHKRNWVQSKDKALTTMYNRQMLKLIYNYDWEW